MKPQLFFCVLLFSCATRSPPLDGKMYDFSREQGNGVLHVEHRHTAAYCRGVAPRPEDVPKARPHGGMLYLRKADADERGAAINDLRLPIVDSILTDADGHGWASLPAGRFLLLDQDRAYDHRYVQILNDHAQATDHYKAVDRTCLENWLKGPFDVIRITAGDTLHVHRSTHGKCPWAALPCVQYTGPLPP